jgi:N-acetylneuraminic acid mutarotase
MPTPRVNVAVAVCNDKIYVVGGFNETSQLSYSLNEVYDPSNNTWTTAAPMPTSRGAMSAAAVNGKIYVVGGGTATSPERVSADGTDVVDVIEIYDPANNSWSTGAPMPYAVQYYASAAVDNSIYVIGGQPQNHYGVLFNQIYNTETNSWSLGSAFPGTPFLTAGAGATTGVNAPKRVYVFGGLIGYFAWSNQSYAYDPGTDSWGIAAAYVKTLGAAQQQHSNTIQEMLTLSLAEKFEN